MSIINSSCFLKKTYERKRHRFHPNPLQERHGQMWGRNDCFFWLYIFGELKQSFRFFQIHGSIFEYLALLSKFLENDGKMHLQFFDLVTRQWNPLFAETTIGRWNQPFSDLKTLGSSKCTDRNFKYFWSFFERAIFFERIICCIDRLDNRVELMSLLLIENQ